uniref:Uncharacterized protein n=1 Tax=Cannabis sativa TaxID=3483 RepID=A0A803R9E0_CANSA
MERLILFRERFKQRSLKQNIRIHGKRKTNDIFFFFLNIFTKLNTIEILILIFHYNTWHNYLFILCVIFSFEVSI